VRPATATLSVFLILAACERPDDSVARLRSWFGIAGANTTGELRVQLLVVLPPGTSREQVMGRFATAGVGRAGVGSAQEGPPDRTVFLRTGGVQRGFVLHELAVAFSFGSDDRLTDIKVEEWRTGL
jgi:hypothetical protein